MSIDSLDNKGAAVSSPADSSLSAHLWTALRDLRFGSVEIVVHDGRVVQIERRERLRLEPKKS